MTPDLPAHEAPDDYLLHPWVLNNFPADVDFLADAKDKAIKRRQQRSKRQAQFVQVICPYCNTDYGRMAGDLVDKGSVPRCKYCGGRLERKYRKQGKKRRSIQAKRLKEKVPPVRHCPRCNAKLRVGNKGDYCAPCKIHVGEFF